MKKGCVYCEDMHLNRCPDAFTEVAQYCRSYNHEEMPEITPPEVKEGERNAEIEEGAVDAPPLSFLKIWVVSD